jgi:hypothetical protein
MDTASLVWGETLILYVITSERGVTRKNARIYIDSFTTFLGYHEEKNHHQKEEEEEEKILNKCGPYYGNMSIKIPYLRKDTSTLLVFSAAATLMLLLASPLVLPNPLLLLQPAQAQTELTFQTPKPATGTDPHGDSISLTFYAQGTPSTSNPSSVDITNGTIYYEVLGGTYTGGITSVSFTNNTSGGHISFETSVGAGPFTVTSNCSTSDNNEIRLTGGYSLKGPVECTSSSSQGGGGNTTSSMTGTTTTTQDSDRDGIPDSSDSCTHNSNQRCFKEGYTTTQQQSSTSLPGNQTR